MARRSKEGTAAGDRQAALPTGPPGVGQDELERDWGVPAGPAQDLLETYETDIPAGLTPQESWDDFFEAPEGIVVCQVRRRSPETWFDPKTGERVNALGYCGEVPYGADVERHIAETWGGGKYQVSLLHNHRFRRGRMVQLPGPPFIVQKAPPLFIPNGSVLSPAEAGYKLPDSPTTDPLGSDGGTRDDWEERLTRFSVRQQMLKTISPMPAPDINAGLLQLVVALIGTLNKGETSGSLREQLENMQLVREMVGAENGGGGGGGMMDLFGKALEALPKLAALSQMKNRSAVGAARELPPPPPPAATGATLEVTDSTTPAPRDNLTAYQETIDRALDTIAAHYSLSPATAPATVAGALMVAFPLPLPFRERVKANAAELAAYGITLLSDEQLAQPGAANAWTCYVVAVIESFADPNRKGPLEGLKL